MKKLITAALFLAAILALAGCATSKENKKGKEKDAVEATTEDIYEETAQTTPVEIPAAEYVDLGEYKNMTIEVEKAVVTEADVEEEIESYLEGYADYQEIKDRDTVQEGDYVNIDYTCTIDGKKSDDYSDTDVDVKAGDGELNEYLGSGLGDDFQLESQVIGSKVGSTVSTEFTFPDNYDDDSVAGKKCKMSVTLNKISEEVIPELTDAFVKEYTDSKSVDDYKKEVRQSLEEQTATEAEDRAREQLWRKVVDNAKQKKDFTPEMIAQETENVKIENQEIAEFYYGMNVEEFINEIAGMTIDEYVKFSLKGQCVQDLLMEAENVTVTDEEFQQEMKNVMEETGLESVEEVTEIYSEESIRDDLIAKKLFKKLFEYNTIKYVDMAPVSEQEN